MFINYNINTGLKIESHQSGYSNDDVAGLVDDMLSGVNGSCPLAGSKAALEDGGLWQGSNATQEILEQIHAVICEHEKSKA